MNAQDFLNDRSGHHIRFLFKSYLDMLDEMKKIHEINFEKLYEHLPEEHHGIVDMADYFDDKHHELIRKRVLDVGNSVLRDYYSELENLTVEFRFKQ